MQTPRPPSDLLDQNLHCHKVPRWFACTPEFQGSCSEMLLMLGPSSESVGELKKTTHKGSWIPNSKDSDPVQLKQGLGICYETRSQGNSAA